MLTRVTRTGALKASMIFSQGLFALNPDPSTLETIASFTAQIQAPFTSEANLLEATPSQMPKPRPISG